MTYIFVVESKPYLYNKPVKSEWQQNCCYGQHNNRNNDAVSKNDKNRESCVLNLIPRVLVYMSFNKLAQ